MKKNIKLLLAAGVALGSVAIGGTIVMNNLKKKLIEEGPKTVAHYIHDNKDKKPVSFVLRRNGKLLASVNADMQMPLASMSKWTVAIEYAKQVAQGILDPMEKIDLTILEQYYLPNTDGGAQPNWISSLEEKELIEDGKATLREVARGMIMFSSNANTDYLMYRLGIENINHTIKEMGLTGHSEVYPIVAALCIGDYIQQQTGMSSEEVKEKLVNMTEEEYVATVMEIYELMNANKLPEEVKALALVSKDMDFQRIWSDRFISATANDYLRMMELINSRTYFDEATQEELNYVVEFMMETSGIAEKMNHFGMKGGSTSWVLTDARYAEDKEGNKIELVVMFDALEGEDYETILNNMDLFMTFVMVNDKIRDNVIEILK